MSDDHKDRDTATSAARDVLIWVGLALALVVIFAISVGVGYALAS